MSNRNKVRRRTIQAFPRFFDGIGGVETTQEYELGCQVGKGTIQLAGQHVVAVDLIRPTAKKLPNIGLVIDGATCCTASSSSGMVIEVVVMTPADTAPRKQLVASVLEKTCDLRN